MYNLVCLVVDANSFAGDQDLLNTFIRLTKDILPEIVSGREARDVFSLIVCSDSSSSGWHTVREYPCTDRWESLEKWARSIECRFGPMDSSIADGLEAALEVFDSRLPDKSQIREYACILFTNSMIYQNVSTFVTPTATYSRSIYDLAFEYSHRNIPLSVVTAQSSESVIWKYWQRIFSISAFITEDGKLREEKIVREHRPFTFFLRCVTKKTGIRDGLERLGKIELKAVNISFHVFGKPTNDECRVFLSKPCDLNVLTKSELESRMHTKWENFQRFAEETTLVVEMGSEEAYTRFIREIDRTAKQRDPVIYHISQRGSPGYLLLEFPSTFQYPFVCRGFYGTRTKTEPMRTAGATPQMHPRPTQPMHAGAAVLHTATAAQSDLEPIGSTTYRNMVVPIYRSRSTGAQYLWFSGRWIDRRQVRL
eukprot:TRINITY_DN18043_c0_g1_i1.p1 TRINITY_DN18043_c0_g1~~TRINITY_DN18043_c0_g1_i1.p1  ORF type:complete len:424 (-),score=63.38 TRINITY_DN18043_c0_g1_i1:57-1328(-)